MFKKLLFCALLVISLGLGSNIVLAADTIKVGAPLPMTGPYAGDGIGYYQGVKFAIDEINAAGGLLGKQLELIRFDTQDFAPERVMMAADQLIGQDKVDVIHAGWAGWGQDVRSYGKYDVPTFVLNASISAVNVFRENPQQYSNWFQMNDVERNLAIDLFDVMEQLPYEYPNKKIAVITADDSWGTESGTGVKDRAKEKGWKVVVDEVVPYGTREWGPILTKIRKTKPAWIYMEIVSAPDCITFFRQFMKAPTASLINLGYGISPPDVIGNLGDEGEGILGYFLGIPGPTAPNPKANAWLDQFRNKFNNEPAANTFPTYVGVKWWAEAVEKVGDVKAYKKICDYIASNPYMDIAGRKLWFDEDHKSPIQSWPMAHLQIQNGEMITIYTGPGKGYLDYKYKLPPWIKK